MNDDAVRSNRQENAICAAAETHRLQSFVLRILSQGCVVLPDVVPVLPLYTTDLIQLDVKHGSLVSVRTVLQLLATCACQLFACIVVRGRGVSCNIVQQTDHTALALVIALQHTLLQVMLDVPDVPVSVRNDLLTWMFERMNSSLEEDSERVNRDGSSSYLWCSFVCARKRRCSSRCIPRLLWWLLHLASKCKYDIVFPL